MSLIAAMRIDEVVDRMQAHDRLLNVDGDPRRHFHGTYLRTILALRAGLTAGRFVDAGWVEQWAVEFAGYYLDALGPDPSDVWRSAFRDGPLSPRQRVLLGMHTHISHDLPLALLDVMADDEFADARARKRRRRDHDAIDRVLAQRVIPELRHVGVRAVQGSGMTIRRLRAARADVWSNADALAEARQTSPADFDARRRELAKITLDVCDVIASPAWPSTLTTTRLGVRLTTTVAGIRGDTAVLDKA
ncbi:MAG: DUF5995 family protein [Nocardioides sp.]